MDANRYEKIGKNIIEEFYWAGKMIVYVNNHLTEKTYEEALEEVRKAS